MLRRDLLKASPLVLASTVGHVALAQSTAEPLAAEAGHNRYGTCAGTAPRATGRPSTPRRSIRRLKLSQRRVAGRWCFRRERIYAFRFI